MPLITLTTDFGLQDHYVGVIKAAILGICPKVRLVDISHEIPPQDITAGAWVVRNAALYFPPGTIHLVTVDPGVGTERKPVALKIQDQIFVGPDNGLFSLIGEEYEYQAFHLTNELYWRKNRSNTFDGRDIFAPVAAHLANGVPMEEMGVPLEKLVTYRWAAPISDPDGIQGWVVHIDRFGNLVTNISEEISTETARDQAIRIYVGNTILDEIDETFASVTEGEPVAYIGSSGNLEIAINKGNAQVMLGVEKGAQVSIVVQKPVQ